MTALLEQIRTLLDAPTSGAEAPPLARVEDTLTAGYARALALEAERWRLERKLTETAGKLTGPTARVGATELAGLAKRITTAETELMRLRSLLGSLRDRAGQLRLARQPA